MSDKIDKLCKLLENSGSLNQSQPSAENTQPISDNKQMNNLKLSMFKLD